MSEMKNNVPAKKSIVAYRVIAALIAIACVAAFFLPFHFFVDYYFGKGIALTELKLYEVFDLVEFAPYKFLGFIPIFTNSKTILGLSGGLVPYILMVALVVAFLFAILALILGKKAENLLFLSIIVFTWGAALYMIAVVSITCYLPKEIVFDLSSIVLAAVGSIALLVTMFVKLGKKLAILNAARFLLTLGFTVCLLLSLSYNYDLVSQLVLHGKLYEVALIVAVALTLVNAILASARAFKKKAFSFDFINAITEFVIAGALIGFAVSSPIKDSALLLLCGISAGIAVILLILTFVGVKIAKKKAKMETLAAFVEKIAKAEETSANTPSIEKASVCESKKTDAFLNSLDETEQSQFAALYVGKGENAMPEIPAYQVGGDNQYFFEMVFITLGEYRDEIPDALLAKMYDYACATYPQAEVPKV